MKSEREGQTPEEFVDCLYEPEFLPDGSDLEWEREAPFYRPVYVRKQTDYKPTRRAPRVDPDELRRMMED